MSDYKPGTIITYTGKFVDPLNLKREDVCLRDIAHALALKPRYNGHCREFYSVAQHCCLAAEYASGVECSQALALLHDASEAYLFDIPRPLKDRASFQPCLHIEDDATKVILDKYLPGWTAWGRQPWNRIDRQLLTNECRVLLTNWELIPAANEILDINIPIDPWPWQEAEKVFLIVAGMLGIED